MLIREDGYIVSVPDTTSTHTITALDGTGASFSPKTITRVDGSNDSANIVHQLIDGTIAATLVGDLPPSGTLTVIFTSDNEMRAAREILARPCAFALASSTRPVVDMTFIRQGQLRPGMNDTVRSIWEFEVGYQEVIP